MKIFEFIERRIAEHYLERKRYYFYSNYPRIACYSSDLISQDIFTRGRYEKEECENLKKFIFPKLAKRRVCLDIGANIGNHSLFFSEFFENVISFEPNPLSFRLLKLNVEEFNNIEAINLGASDIKGQLSALENLTNIGETEIGRDRTGFKDEIFRKIELNVNLLDDVLPKHILSKVDFIKIDTEGHEFQALSGLKGTLTSAEAIIAFEFLVTVYTKGVPPIVDLLSKCGYKYFYEFERVGHLLRVPRRFESIAKVLRLIIYGKKYYLLKLDEFKPKDYPLVIASKYPI
ncbi:MAG: FkbM family methyltransferase [Bacteroidales bacterium]